MPHFVIHCSEKIVQSKSPHVILMAVLNEAESSGLFAKGDIKVRIQPFKHHFTGNGNDDFIHVFANIMEGRGIEEKKDLSNQIVSKLNNLFPNVPIISMNVIDFEKDSYTNKSMLLH